MESGCVFHADFDTFHDRSEDVRTYGDCHFCMHRTLNVYCKLDRQLNKIDAAMTFWNFVHSQNCRISYHVICYSVIFHALILLFFFQYSYHTMVRIIKNINCKFRVYFSYGSVTDTFYMAPTSNQMKSSETLEYTGVHDSTFCHPIIMTKVSPFNGLVYYAL